MLLRAALLSGEQAIDAWQKWNSAVDINTIDVGSKRLLPLLYVNLKSLGIDHPLMQKFKGVYRRAWYDNHLLLRSVSSFLRSLHEERIETVLLKGAALTQLYYKDLGLRPMIDVDLLVPVSSAARALRLAIALSYKPTLDRPVAIDRLAESEIFKASVHSENLVDTNGRGLDLHWHVLFESLDEDADKEFWDAAIPLTFQGVPTAVFNSADQLLHVCSHGIVWNSVPTIRWVADAMMILRCAPDMDWDRVLRQAKTHGLALDMKDSLGYLVSTVDAPVPGEVLRTLGETRVSTVDSMWYRLKTERPMEGTVERFLWLVRTYIRSGRKAVRGERKVGFTRYLQYAWGVNKLWQVPFFGTSAALARLRVFWRRRILS